MIIKEQVLGAEIKSSILELNTNHYFAISNEKTGKNNIKEEVADGYDIRNRSPCSIHTNCKILY